MTRDEFRFRAIGLCGALLLRFAGRTFRVRVDGDEALREFRRQGQPVIFAFWHSRILPLAYLHRDEGIVVLVSEHGDGEAIARIIHRLGFSTRRGSSTRGGAKGLRALVRAGKDGNDLGITPDGPRGPARKCKPGALVAAQLTGAPVLPLAAGGPSLWRMGSWDRHVVPKPFAKLRLEYGRPFYVPRDAGPEDLARIGGELESELDRITDAVDRNEGTSSKARPLASSHG